MVKYIIKVTYAEGIHKGKTYYLDKQGYVRDNLDCIWQDGAYTLTSCKAVCTRKEKSNTAEVIFEKRQRARRIAEGKTVSKYPINEIKKYEPFAIKTVD